MISLQRTVIFGATSAIAQAVARQLVAKGCSVYCIGRDPAKLAALLADLRVRAGSNQVIEGEVADLNVFQAHPALLTAAEKALGGIDGVLVAHGSLPNQQACAASMALSVQELTTNGLSAVSILGLAANRLEAQRSGVVAVIGSVAGDRGRQSNYVYGAAKGMLGIFMQGLRNRLSKAGVATVTIKPGFVDTPMTAGLAKGGPLWASADRVASGIVVAMEKGKGEVYLPGFWQLIMFVIRNIPSAVFNRMSL